MHNYWKFLLLIVSKSGEINKSKRCLCSFQRKKRDKFLKHQIEQI